MFHGTWNKTKAKSYLNVLGVKKAFASDGIIEKAISCHNEETYPSNLSTNTILSRLKFPSLWTSNSELDKCIDTPMHQIFLGMMKSIIKFIGKWYKSQNRMTKFIDSFNKNMAAVQTLRLDCCKMDRITSVDKLTGGWVAESYLAYARLMPG